MDDWDPELYNRFRRYRAEAFEEILKRLVLDPSERVLDLGCGSGENTVELTRRSPMGSALGIDLSAAMIRSAEKLRLSLPVKLRARVRFAFGDLREITAREEYTLLCSNAAMHWVSNHRAVVASCYRALVPGGRMVLQMPANEQGVAQATLRQMVREAPWRAATGSVSVPSHTVGTPGDYRRMLMEVGFTEVEAYYRTFVHHMNSPAEVLKFIRATTLRPFLNALPQKRQTPFLAELRTRLERAYRTTGPLRFNFRRLFIWGRRPAN